MNSTSIFDNAHGLLGEFSPVDHEDRDAHLLCTDANKSHLPQTISNRDMRSLSMVCEFGMKDKPEMKMGEPRLSVPNLPLSASHWIS